MSPHDGVTDGFEPEIDLTGVHPSCRIETHRRALAAIEWLARGNNDPAAEAAAAARLGLKLPGFRNLVQAWSDHGRAAMLPGARFAARRSNRLNPSFGRQAETIIAEVIADLGADARRKEVVEETMRRCEAAGTAAPSGPSITARLYRARSLLETHDRRPLLIVDHCAMRLPVLHDGLVRAPVATMVFDGSRRIYAFDMGMNGPVPQTAARVLAAALRRPANGTAEAHLRMNADFTPGWKAVLAAIDRAHVHREGKAAAPVPSYRDMRRTFGDAVGNVALMPLATHSTSEVAYLAKLRSTPLTLEGARAAMEDAVLIHNRSLPTAGDRPRIASDEDERVLCRELGHLAAELTEVPRKRRKR